MSAAPELTPAGQRTLACPDWETVHDRAGAMFAAVHAATVEHDVAELSVLEAIVKAPHAFRSSCLPGAMVVPALASRPTVRGFEVAAIVAAIVACTMDDDAADIVERVCASMGIDAATSSLVLEPYSELRALLRHRCLPTRPLGSLSWEVCDAVVRTSRFRSPEQMRLAAVGQLLAGGPSEVRGPGTATIDCSA